jgi:hypothetical protein
MTVKTEALPRAYEWLRSEAPGTRSRDTATVTVSGGAGMKSGTVLGRVTASGKLIAYSNAASDGSQTAVALLGPDLTGEPNGDVRAVVLNTDCEVEESMLTGLDAAGKTDLLALGFKFRA